MAKTELGASTLARAGPWEQPLPGIKGIQMVCHI